MRRSTSARKPPVTLPGRLAPLRCACPARSANRSTVGALHPRGPASPGGAGSRGGGAGGGRLGDRAWGAEGDGPGSPTGEGCLPWRLTPVSSPPLPALLREAEQVTGAQGQRQVRTLRGEWQRLSQPQDPKSSSPGPWSRPKSSLMAGRKPPPGAGRLRL